MDIDSCVKAYLQNYNFFLEQLVYLFKETEYKDLLISLNEEPKDKKWLRGMRFQQQLTDELFGSFVESRIKVFSHKDENTKSLSDSLFGEEISLKKIFNNRDNNTKFVLWAYLHLMVLMVELAQKTQNKDRIKKLTKMTEQNAGELKKVKVKVTQQNSAVKDPKNMLKDMFNIDLNDQTNEMLTDIIGSFETSIKGGNANPLSGILDISQKISSKYQSKINSGEIELNKIMEGIQSKIPGMDEIMKGGLGGMMGAFNGAPAKPKETVIIDENFSTANVEMGQQTDSTGSGFNIGKMLNLANTFGVLPGTGTSSAPGPGTDALGGMKLDPQLSELFKMITSSDMTSEDGMKEMKTKMDSFLAEQGIDINSLNTSIENMMAKPSTEIVNSDNTVKKEDIIEELVIN